MDVLTLLNFENPFTNDIIRANIYNKIGLKQNKMPRIARMEREYTVYIAQYCKMLFALLHLYLVKITVDNHYPHIMYNVDKSLIPFMICAIFNNKKPQSFCFVSANF